MERPGDVTFQGNPLTAIGLRVKVGDKVELLGQAAGAAKDAR